ncbi:histidine kinase [Aquabacterium sp.]|uniref:histidine kinase n=1 Tax=Aquabacterium sp. TaxID=1872578 RepID=UPI0035B4B2B4
MTHLPPTSRPPRPTPPADAQQSTLFGLTELGVSDWQHARRQAWRVDGSALDVCHVGVVLRTVLAVHLAVLLGVAFVATGWREALLLFSSATVVSLPAVLMWLLTACATQRWVARWPLALQWAALAGLGAVCAALPAWPLRGTVPDVFGWARPGPLLAVGAVAGASVFHWLRLRSRLVMPAATSARLVELQARIRPHFLFNTLNTAIALVRVDPARAETLLEDLAELFRAALADAQAQVTLEQEVELARRYLDIEQVRFGQRLQVVWELDAQANPARLPPLILQPLVENAVKHGVEPSAEGGTIRIKTSVHRGQAVLLVSNTVSGAPSTPGHGIALHNVQERLQLMHDVAARFETSQRDGEYRVRIVVPL